MVTVIYAVLSIIVVHARNPFTIAATSSAAASTSSVPGQLMMMMMLASCNSNVHRVTGCSTSSADRAIDRQGTTMLGMKYGILELNGADLFPIIIILNEKCVAAAAAAP